MSPREKNALRMLLTLMACACVWIGWQRLISKPTPLPEETSRIFNQLLKHGE